MKKLLFGLLATVVTLTAGIDAATVSVPRISVPRISAPRVVAPAPKPIASPAPTPKANAGYGTSTTTTTTTTTTPSANAGYGNSSSTTNTTPTTGVSTKASTPDAIKSYNNKTAIAPTKTKAEIAADFKKANADKYKTTFESEPATRPSYVPTSVNSGGTTHTIIYNNTTHGYGYYGSDGRWILYDALAIAAMSHANATYVAPAPVVYTHGVGYYIGLVITLILVALVIILFVAIIA